MQVQDEDEHAENPQPSPTKSSPTGGEWRKGCGYWELGHRDYTLAQVHVLVGESNTLQRKIETVRSGIIVMSFSSEFAYIVKGEGKSDK